MQAALDMRRRLIDSALEALVKRPEKKPERIRQGGRLFPAEDCEFPEEAPQEFPEDGPDAEFEEE